THIHADHITSALELKKRLGSKIAAPVQSALSCADTKIQEGREFQVGSITIQPMFTPGHTDDHYAYLMNERVFTGDALLIDGCGRTDFQNGNSDLLYDSV